MNHDCTVHQNSQNYPELDYDETFRLRILEGVLSFRYRKNDYNTGVQLLTTNHSSLYPIIYSDLRMGEQEKSDQWTQTVFHYRLNYNEATKAQDYTIFAAILYEGEIVLDIVGGELVVVKNIFKNINSNTN